MAREVIRLGDFTSHDGRVITARARMTIDGIPVALWGDHCSCPYCGHDNCVICEGEVEAMFDGVPVALEGHKTSCGATLFPAVKGRCDSKPLVKRANVATGVPRRTPNVPSDASSSESGKTYDEQVRLIDDDGNPLENVPYYITDQSGNSYKGITDSLGCCERVYTDDEQMLEIHTGVPALERW